MRTAKTLIPLAFLLVPVASACGGADSGGPDDSADDMRRRHSDSGIDATPTTDGGTGTSDASTPDATPSGSGDAGVSDSSAPPPQDGGGTLAATDCTVVRCHYIRSGATGSGDGSDWVNAYALLPSTFVRGDTYFVATGSYTGTTFNTPTSGTTVITLKRAIESDHGTNTGWSTSYGTGQAAFDGMLEFTSSHWVLDGQTGGGVENQWDQNFGFKITETSDTNALIRLGYTGTADDVTIRHVEMQGKGSVSTDGGYYSNDGLAIYGASGTTLSHYWMRGIGRCPFFISAKDAVFEHGWVESFFASDPVHAEIASTWGDVGDNTFRYNLFTDIQGTGGLMWDNSQNNAAHMYVYGNVFYKPAGATWGGSNGLIGGWTGANGEECRNLLVYDNTFVNVHQETLSSLPRIYSGNVAYNNLFFNCDSPNFTIFETHDYNHFIASGGAQSEPNGTSASSGDPFVNASGFDFRLNAATSPGMTLLSPYDLDPLGVRRGADGTWDRGAFELGAP